MRAWLYLLFTIEILLTAGLGWCVLHVSRPAPAPPPPPVLELDAETRGALLELAGRLSDVEASCVWLPRSERLRVASVPPTKGRPAEVR